MLNKRRQYSAVAALVASGRFEKSGNTQWDSKPHYQYIISSRERGCCSTWTRNGDMSSQAFCFCNNCRGEVRCHRTTIQRHFERDILSGSLESNDVSFATQATESEYEIEGVISLKRNYKIL